MNARTSSRKAISSGVKRRSMAALLESNPFRLNHSALPTFCFAHDLVRKPVPTFRDHALVDFEQAGGAHAAADAHRDDARLDAAPRPSMQRVAGHARAGHAVGMADGDRAAVDVEPLVRNAEPVAAIERPAPRRPRSAPTGRCRRPSDRAA